MGTGSGRIPAFRLSGRQANAGDVLGLQVEGIQQAVGVKVTPYSLRHTAAIESLRNGGNVFYVQRQLGHSSLVMTKRYLHLVEADIHREHAKASPVGNLFPSRTRVKKVKRKE